MNWKLLEHHSRVCARGGARSTEICTCPHKPDYAWRKVLWSEGEKLYSHDSNDKRCAWKSKGEAVKPKNTEHALGAVMLPAVLVHYKKWMEQ